MDRSTLAKSVWFLDYDGTLCPHLESWETRSYAPADILKTLGHLNDQGARVLWNTGRRVESIGAMHPSFLDYSGFFIQGTLFWSAPRHEELRLSESLPKTYAAFIESQIENRKEYRLELKPTSLRVSSFKGDLDAELRLFMDPIIAQTPQGWRWILGQRAAELLPEGFDKGTAIVREMGLAISENLIPVAVGDDLFDRPAFVASLARGGYAILVGNNEEAFRGLSGAPDRLLRFATPAAFTEWLESL